MMVWRRTDDKPLSEAMRFSLLMRIGVTKHPWFNRCPYMYGFISYIMTWKSFPHNWPFLMGIHRQPGAVMQMLSFVVTEYRKTWWRHQMETFSALLAICAWNSPVPGEFRAQRPVTRSFDVFFDLRLYKRLSRQSWGWWFATLSCPLWRHCNDELKSARTGTEHFDYSAIIHTLVITDDIS